MEGWNASSLLEPAAAWEAASARPTMSASSAWAAPGCGAAGRLGVSSNAGALCITGLVAGAELFFGAATSHSSVFVLRAAPMLLHDQSDSVQVLFFIVFFSIPAVQMVLRAACS